MNKQLWLSLVVVAVGISACNDDSLPTGAERDLLKDAANIPALGGSKYTSALEVFMTEAGTIKDTIRIQPPTTPVSPGDQAWVELEHETDEGTGNRTKYKPRGWVHINDEYNRSKYKPSGSEHIKEGVNKTKYQPSGWVHYGGPPSIDNTKYLPPGYVHISKGPDESKYYKPAATTPADTVKPGSGEVPGSN